MSRSAVERRIVFYSHDSFGLGHLRRTLALASVVSESPGTSSLIVTGSTLASSYRLPPRVDTVKLPAVTKNGTGGYEALRLPLSSEDILRVRAELILAAAAGFDPDVIVVDKTPLGLRGELVPTLDWLQVRGACKAVLGLRDIEDSRENVRREWGKGRLRERIERYYDQILVYGPEMTMDAFDYLGWNELSVPLAHVGYVGTPSPEGAPADLSPAYLLVTVGGGGDGFRVVKTFVEAIRAKPLDCDALIVTGPLMRDADIRRIAEMASGLRVRVEEFRSDMEHVVAGARAVVAMAGYNTVAELIAARKPALLIPRAQPREEQLIRARTVAEAGLAQVLHPDELDPSKMRAALESLLTMQAPPGQAETGDGAARAASILLRVADDAILRRAATSSPTLEDFAPGR